MQELALDIEDEARTRSATAPQPLDPDDPASLAHEVSQPLAAIVASADACVRWLGADPPNIERARIAAERIIRDAKVAAELAALLPRARRPHPADLSKGDEST